MNGHRARKRFGQNFLHDGRIIDAIVRRFDPQPDQLVVEIGPGLGALTQPLLEQLTHMHVVELDRDLVSRLQERFAQHLTVHAVDALNFDFSSLVDDGSKLRVIGNLPYNISTPLLFHMLEQAGCISDMMFMLQKEVVQRMLASPGSKAYGRLTVMLQSRCTMQKVLDVGPGAFSPPPKVDSAVVRLIPLPVARDPVCEAPCFADLVRASFAQRRKTLRNNLKNYLDADQILAVGVDPGCRAETLSLEEFINLARVYCEVQAGTS